MIRETTLDNGEFAVITSHEGFDQCTLGSKHEELRIHINSSLRVLCQAQVKELLPYLYRFAETGRLDPSIDDHVVELRWIEDGQERGLLSSDIESIRAKASALLSQGNVQNIILPEVKEIKQ